MSCATRPAHTDHATASAKPVPLFWGEWDDVVVPPSTPSSPRPLRCRAPTSVAPIAGTSPAVGLGDDGSAADCSAGTGGMVDTRAGEALAARMTEMVGCTSTHTRVLQPAIAAPCRCRRSLFSGDLPHGLGANDSVQQGVRSLGASPSRIRCRGRRTLQSEWVGCVSQPHDAHTLTAPSRHPSPFQILHTKGLRIHTIRASAPGQSDTHSWCRGTGDRRHPSPARVRVGRLLQPRQQQLAKALHVGAHTRRPTVARDGSEDHWARPCGLERRHVGG